MKSYDYRPRGVCSRLIHLTLDDLAGVVRSEEHTSELQSL